MLDFNISWIFQPIWTSFEKIHKWFCCYRNLKKEQLLAEPSNFLHEAYIISFTGFLIESMSKEICEYDPLLLKKKPCH